MHLFQSFLSFVVSMSIDNDIVPVTTIIANLCIHSNFILAYAEDMINEEAKIIPYTQFYNAAVSQRRDLRQDYMQWKRYFTNTSHVVSSVNVFSFLRFPFLLDPAAKTTILHVDAAEQMQHQVQVELRMVYLTESANAYRGNRYPCRSIFSLFGVFDTT